MGRGRQKAMAKKDARKIKYYSPEIDYDAVVEDLQSSSHIQNPAASDDLEEYLAWAKETAEKATQKK